MAYSFDATMVYLRDHDIISSQADLSRLLGVKTATVTGMKQRGAISEGNIEKIARKLAELRNEPLGEILEELRQEIPKVEGPIRKGGAQTEKCDYCRPSKKKYVEFLRDIPTSKVKFSNIVSISKEIAGKHGGCDNIIYMSYLKTSLEPDIKVNDTLVVKSTKAIEGEGYYLFDCEYDIDIKYLRFSGIERELISISDNRIEKNNESISLKEVTINIIGKILCVYREL